MRKSKLILCSALSAAMVLGLTACGEQGAAKGTTAAETTTVAATTAAPATEAATAASEAAATTAAETSAAEAAASAAAVTYDEEAWKQEPAYGKKVLYYYTGGNCTSAPWFAEVLGYYEKEGLEVEMVAGTSYTEALGTGAAQLAVGHISTMLVPATNGVELEFVAGAHTGCRSLYALADGNVKTTADLVGKKVSIPDGIGSSGYNITSRFFDMDGINPREDIQIVQVENDAAIKAMENGEVGATLFSDTYAYSFVKDGTLKLVRSLLDDDFAKEPCCVLAMNKKFVSENPITSQKITDCVRQASKWMEENSPEAVKMLIDNNMISGDYDMNVEMFEALDFDIDKDFSEAGLKQIIADYIRLDLITAYEEGQEAEVEELVWNPLES